jgi:hypothetical protein
MRRPISPRLAVIMVYLCVSCILVPPSALAFHSRTCIPFPALHCMHFIYDALVRVDAEGTEGPEADGSEYVEEPDAYPENVQQEPGTNFPSDQQDLFGAPGKHLSILTPVNEYCIIIGILYIAWVIILISMYMNHCCIYPLLALVIIVLDDPSPPVVANELKF